MKRSLVTATLLTLWAVSALGQGKSFYDHTVKDIDGNDFPLYLLKGKKVMVVNVASQCGLTPQYSRLQELYEKYGPDNFTVVAFPSNDFLGQEPGTNEQIAAFCEENYGVTFPIMSKISVIGEDIEPLYHWLTSGSLNGVEDAPVSWNFQKFLIDEDGRWVGSVPPQILPDDKQILDWIGN